MAFDLQADVEAIGRIAAVPTILEVVCRTTGMGMAAIARVTEDRWIACSVRDEIEFGLKAGGELKVDTTICAEIRQSREPVVINHVSQDKSYCHHPTPMLYGFESYISMPIILADGSFFGTLCAIDMKPAQVNTPEVIGMFRLFAELIAFHLDATKKLEASEARLADARATADLREEFIAVLGHDLRNPLASIGAGVRLLRKTPLNDRAIELLGLMQNSVVRMSGLIDNVLDLARGRLGGGIALRRDPDETLEFSLSQIIAELKVTSPGRRIDTEIDLTQPVDCDRGRIGQMFSNLLGNALTYSPPEKPVRVRAFTRGDMFELSVANTGEPIPEAMMEHLFQPFTRGSFHANQQGLGLGLYIAMEIAKAHGGTLTVSSTREETCFTFRMPLMKAAGAAEAERVASA